MIKYETSWSLKIEKSMSQAVGNTQTFFIVSLFFILQTVANLKFNLVQFDDMDMEAGYYFTLRNKNMILLREAVSLSSLEPFPYRSSSNHLFYRPNENSYSPWFFLQTFETSLWLYFVCFFGCIFICFWIGSKLIGKRCNVLKLFDFVSLMQGHSLQIIGTAISYRILIIMFSLLLIIFYATFGAFLDVLLSIKIIDLPFANINELLRRKDYTLCVPIFSQVHFSLTHEINDVHQQIIVNSRYCPLTDSITYQWFQDFTFECKKTKITFFFAEHESEFEEFLIRKCNLVKFSGKYYNTQATFLTSLEFGYKELLNQKIIKARTSGNIDYIINTAYINILPINVQPTIIHNHIEIEFDHCKVIIIILFIGYAMSMAILILELVWIRWKK